EEIDRYYKDLNGKEPEIAEEEVSAPRKRVGRYKSKKVFSSKSEAEDKQGTKYLKDDGSGRVKLVNCSFDFPECPVSWVDEYLKELAGILYHTEKANLPFFSGGVADQLYKFYRIGKVVSGEANEIESEE